MLLLKRGRRVYSHRIKRQFFEGSYRPVTDQSKNDRCTVHGCTATKQWISELMLQYRESQKPSYGNVTMQRKLLITIFSVLLCAASHGVVLADEDNVNRQCMAEAENYGITDLEELAEFMNQCTADLAENDSDLPPPIE